MNSPPFDPKDPFDRQRCILDWNQKLIEEQICFVLGVGAIGCTIAMSLARLGVKSIILLDNDMVEISNLNRQILFKQSDVGRRKVDSAKEGLLHHNLRSEILCLHIDAISNWDIIVQNASKSTAIFNCIDFGAWFDFAVIRLCQALNISYCSASSYATTMISEYMPLSNSQNQNHSFTIDNEKGEYSLLLKQDKILIHKNLSFLPGDKKPDTRSIGSNSIVACTSALLAVNNWVQNITTGIQMPNWTKMCLQSYWQPEGLITIE